MIERHGADGAMLTRAAVYAMSFGQSLEF